MVSLLHTAVIARPKVVSMSKDDQAVRRLVWTVCGKACTEVYLVASYVRAHQYFDLVLQAPHVDQPLELVAQGRPKDAAPGITRHVTAHKQVQQV